MQHPEQLRLHLGFALADFIQEQGPAVGPLKRAWPVGLGIGKSPFHVPKEFRFQQFPRDRRTVDGDERTALAVAGCMNGPGKEFLPGAAFPNDQDGHVAQSSPLSPADGDANRLALADNPLEPGDFLGILRRKMLECRVWMTQKLRQEINRQVEGDDRFRHLALMRLVEGRGITTLAQQHPNRSHGRCARTQVHAKLGRTPFPSCRDFTQEVVGQLENRRVIGGVVQLHLVDNGLATKPVGKLLVDLGRVVAEKVDLRKGFAVDGRF